jgi:hypothetical protein
LGFLGGFSSFRVFRVQKFKGFSGLVPTVKGFRVFFWITGLFLGVRDLKGVRILGFLDVKVLRT